MTKQTDKNEKVIYMNMKERIEAAKAKAEAEYEAKLEASRACDVDVRDFFTDEELDAILSGNDFFKGRIADLTRVQRHEKLSLAARWMQAHSMEVVALDIEPVSQSRPNAILTMDIRRLASLRGEELRVFTMMSALADSMYISGIKDDVIRFSFCVEKVWQ